MSLKCLSAIKALTHDASGKRLTTPEKLVLFLLADYYNDDRGCAWPSVATLATESLLSERQCYRVLAALEDRKLIAREHRYKDSNEYRILIPGMTLVTPQGGSDLTSDLTPMTISPDTAMAEKQELTVKEQNHVGLAAQGLEWLFSYYVKALGRRPGSYFFSPERKRMLKARLEETVRMKGDIPAAINFMARCVDAITKSDWHMGKNPSGKTYNELENIFSASKYQQWVTAVERNENLED